MCCMRLMLFQVVPFAGLPKKRPRLREVLKKTRHYLQGTELLITGLPLRRELTQCATDSEGDKKDAFTVLVMGGSRGAQAVNQIASDAIVHLQQQGEHKIEVIHLTGRV